MTISKIADLDMSFASPAPAPAPSNVVPISPRGEDKRGERENGEAEFEPPATPFPLLKPSPPPDVGIETLPATGGDKAGKGGSPVPPPLPPLDRPIGASVGPTPAHWINDVLTPAPTDNPVLMALRREGLLGAVDQPGRHHMTCPWNDEHDEDARSSAVYTEPTEALPIGAFTCPHPHGARLHVGVLLDFLEVSPEDARCKPVIRLVKGEINRIGAAAEAVLSEDGRHFHSGGRIVALRREDTTGDLGIEALSDQSLIKALSKRADWQRFDGRSKKWVRCDPRANVINFLLRAQSHDVLRPLNGLARQPYFREDGSLVMRPGYDAAAKVFADFDPDAFVLPDPTEEAGRQALALLKQLLGEFHFAGAGDMAAALSGILTATTRTSLPVAPAFNISASGSGSGKSYLAATLAPFAGPGQPAALPYPTDEADASKKILSLLLTKPAVAIFDDMQTDWLPFGTMNRMLTSETIADRLLGGNRTATVGTRCFFMGTGNNVRPVRDMCRRVITVYLAPRTSSPATLRYKGRPVDTVRRKRGEYVAAALTIIRAWQAAGCPRTDVRYIATYGDVWADMCRHPLIWLGESDPAASLIEQMDSDPDSEALATVLQEWFRQFGSRAIMVRDLVNQAGSALKEALSELPVVERGGDINRDRLGWLLKKNANKVMGGLQLRRTPTSQRTAWSVMKIGDDGSNVPAIRIFATHAEFKASGLRDCDGPFIIAGEMF